jgi:hypothetical protein
LTGVEAVSNAVPNFKEPPAHHARQVLVLLSFFVFICFGGVSLLANIYHVNLVEGKTVLSQIAAAIFGQNSIMFFVIQVTTALILTLAANTAFADFPMLFSVMSRDGYAPRQLSRRGERLSYSNGIIILTILASILLITFNGDTHLLIPLYAVGVFTSFTLSQTGMLVKWFREKTNGWHYKACINGFGALVTLVTTIVIAVTKFIYGAWIVILVVPILMAIFLKMKRHYVAMAEQLRLSPEELDTINLDKDTYKNHVIVPVESVNKASLRALRYAKTICGSITAVNIATDVESEERIREKWALLHTDIPLVVLYSSIRKVLEPLLEFIESYEANSYKKGDMITIIMPQFSVSTWWHIFLHNQTRVFINKELLKHKHVVVATMPLQLRKDKQITPSI